MNNNDEIKKTIQELLVVMGFSGEVEIQRQPDELIVAKIKMTEAGFLIGPGGSSLLAFQHLVRLLVRRRTAQLIPFVVDVNEYRSHRLALLKEMAESFGQRVKTEQRAIELAPMSAFERRLIHLVVKEIPGVASESQGEREQRHVIVRPVSPSD